MSNKAEPWLQFKAPVTPDIADAIEEALMAAESVAVTFEDLANQPLYEPDIGTTPLWKSTQVTGLFPADTDTRQAESMIRSVYSSLTDAELPPFKFEFLEGRDWTRAWLDNFKPMQMGQRLWVCPSWTETPVEAEVKLLLDPGLAFGTGTHPTTALCLAWLDSQDIEGQSIIDYGCGSGILGIGALLLGAKSVLGVDTDPQALLATKDNAERNQVADRVSTSLPEEHSMEPADLLLANILAQPLIGLSQKLAELTKPGGKIVLSGILENQATEVLNTYSAYFDMEDPTVQNGWTRLTGIRK